MTIFYEFIVESVWTYFCHQYLPLTAVYRVIGYLLTTYSYLLWVLFIKIFFSHNNYNDHYFYNYFNDYYYFNDDNNNNTCYNLNEHNFKEHNNQSNNTITPLPKTQL